MPRTSLVNRPLTSPCVPSTAASLPFAADALANLLPAEVAGGVAEGRSPLLLPSFLSEVKRLRPAAVENFTF
jgi:hypothetical protein